MSVCLVQSYTEATTAPSRSCAVDGSYTSCYFVLKYKDKDVLSLTSLKTLSHADSTLFCAQHCSVTPDCHYYIYNKPNSTCTLASNIMDSPLTNVTGVNVYCSWQSLNGVVNAPPPPPPPIPRVYYQYTHLYIGNTGMCAGAISPLFPAGGPGSCSHSTQISPFVNF